jgi:splicing factor 1
MRMLTGGRQRGANWRNDGPGGPPGPTAAAGRIGTGDAVDREYEVSSPAFLGESKTNMI